MARVQSGTTASPPLPVAPTAEAWRAMTPEARERFVIAANEALSDPKCAMGEGRPHRKAKNRAVDTLGLHFGAIGRVVYVADDLTVHYPGEEVFSPDVLAVLDVPQPEDDERLAWVVTDEGKGLDWVLEVLHRGDRQKDLVKNVERYARLGIPEYFVYDRLRQQVHGYRLPGPGPGRYERIVPQHGRYRSQVLGLDLAVVGGTLRFFYGMAELIGTDDLVDRLEGMVEALAAKADEAEAEAEAARSSMRSSILRLLESRRIPCPDEARSQIASCQDMATLQRWLLRATTAGSVDEVLAG